MKINLCAFAISSLLLAGANTGFSDMTEQQYFKDVQKETYEKIVQRLNEIKAQAKSSVGVTTEGNQRYLQYRDGKYRLGAYGNIIFDMPMRHTDEASFRNVFDFLDQDWRLRWHNNGLTVVNKSFGNDDYRNGCFIEYSPDAPMDAVTMDDQSCSGKSFDPIQSYFGPGTTITAEDLGLKSHHIGTIERYGNLLYVAYDVDDGAVIIFNTDTNEVVGRINGITNELGFQRYNRVDDLSVNNGYLYVTSRKSLRVDIFDTKNDHSHVLTLGSRNGSKSWPNYLLLAQAVVADNEYVFAADATSRISVYRQQDLDPAINPDYGVRHGFLEYEGKYSNRTVQMHVLENRYLMVSSADRGNYFIYDTHKLEAAIQAGVDLAPEKVVTPNLQKVDVVGDLLTVSFSNRIEEHSVAEFVANDFTFLEPKKTVTVLNGQPVGPLKDLYFDGKELITAKNGAIAINTLVGSEITFTAGVHVDDAIKLDTLPPGSVVPILGNDEPFNVLTDRDLRSVRVNTLVQTKMLADRTVQITSYAAQKMENLSIELKLNGIDQWFTLGTFDELPAFSQITVPLSFLSKDNRFNSANDDGVLDLNTLVNSEADLVGLFESRFSSETDTFAQKISRLKPTWNIFFATNSTGNWRKMNALYAREWVIILTNFAYMVSTAEFRHAWFNFQKIQGYNMHGPAGASEVPNGFFTPANYQHYYDTMLVRPYTNVGITSKLGLGMAKVFGMRTDVFYTHYYGEWGTIAHEFGHGFNGKTFSHSTSFANSRNGWQPLITQLANYHIRKGDFPYIDENINGFYRPENSAYHYQKVNNSRRKSHRIENHMYTLEKYFLSFSTDLPKGGWFDHSPTFNPNLLSKNDQAIIGSQLVDEETRNICRFQFDGGNGETTLHGIVEQVGDQHRCTTGNRITYLTAEGTKVTATSPLDEFQWLSLYKPESAGEKVTTFNGQPLCVVQTGEFYGVGFVNSTNQCEQQPEVYWENGNHWLFSSTWSGVNYH